MFTCFRVRFQLKEPTFVSSVVTEGLVHYVLSYNSKTIAGLPLYLGSEGNLQRQCYPFCFAR